MKNQELKSYTVDSILVTDKDLVPIVKIISPSRIEIVTKYTSVGEKELKLETTFDIYDETDNRSKLSDLFDEYFSAEYIFLSSGVVEQEKAAPNRIQGGIRVFRADRKTEKLTEIANNYKKLDDPMEGEITNFLRDILELLKNFDHQSDELVKMIREDQMIETQKKYMFNFSENISDRCDRFLNYTLKTKDNVEELKSKGQTAQTVLQDHPVKLDLLLNLKSNILKGVTSLEKEDFDERGIAEKKLNYKVNKQDVETSLVVIEPKEEEIKNTLIFPIDPNVFSLVACKIPPNIYDAKVFNAICTLIDFYTQKNPVDPDSVNIPVTLADIHHAMGYPNKRVSPKEAQRIRNSVLKLSTTQIGYEWSQERNIRDISIHEAINVWGEEVVYANKSHYMLEAEEAYIVPKNSPKDKDGNPISVTGFTIKAFPSIYVHAKVTKTIASVPLEWFDLKKLGRLTDRRNYLIRGLTERISTAYHYKNKEINPNQSNYNVIVFDKFFKEKGIEPNNKQTRSELIKDITKILDEFKDKKIIKNYTWNHKNGAIYSIKFYV